MGRARCTGRSCGSPARSAGAAARRRGRGCAARARTGPPRSASGSARWANDPGVQDRALPVDLVAMPEHPARRLRPAVAGARPGRDGDRRAIRLLVAVDQAERLVEGVEDLHAAHDDAAERVAAPGLEPGLTRGLAGEREPFGVQRNGPSAPPDTCRARAAASAEQSSAAPAPRRSALRTRRADVEPVARGAGRPPADSRPDARAPRTRSPPRARGSRARRPSGRSRAPARGLLEALDERA